MSEKDKFIPSAAFLAKKDSEKIRLIETLRKDLWQELHVLKDDELNDIHVYVEDVNLHLRHKCIIKALAPTLYADIGMNEEQQNIDIKIKNFPDCMSSNELAMIKALYSSEPVSHDLNIDLKVLLESGCHSDVVFKVDDELFQCHKCILASRSEFFKLMFQGKWIETEIDVIPLKGFSAKTFCLVLKMMYNDMDDWPENLNVNELLAVSEMYNINCLKTFLLYHLKVNYCHFFHTPCQLCITGVEKTFLLCKELLFYKDLVKDCCNWFVEHFAKIIQRYSQFQKFHQEAREIMKDKIKESTSSSNLLQRLHNCIQLKARIPDIKSTEPVTTMVTELQKFCIDYCFEHLNQIIREHFLVLLVNDKNVAKHLLLFETLLMHLPEVLNKENCINIYIGALNFEKITKTEEPTEAIENAIMFINGVKNLSKKFIQRNYLHVKRMPQWKKLPKNLKDELMEGSGFLKLAK